MAKKKGKYSVPKSKSKKPIYKRWWFWVLALLLCSGGCTSPQETETKDTEPLPVMTTISTEVTISPTTDVPTTEPATIEPTEPPTTEAVIIESTALQIVAETEYQITYVLNTSSKKFHYPSCSSSDDIKDSNKRIFTGTREQVIAEGYDPCGRCTP